MHPERHPKQDHSAETLTARLRALPPPPVPAGLEARLLADIPADWPFPRLRWAVGAGAVVALAAACLLALLAWPGREIKGPVPELETGPSMKQRSSWMPADSRRMARWQAARRGLDETATPMFTWPLQETSPLKVSNSIPSSLLD